MQTHLRGRDLIDLQEWTKDEISTLLDVAFALKRERALGQPHPHLRDKVLAMLFFFPSTRTRASFEAGMAQLGGHAQFIESRTTQIAHGDTAKEIGEILGRYNDGIAIRHVDWQQGNRYLREVAEASRVPVLNMQCDIYHPHQALADLMTIIERSVIPRPHCHYQLGLRGQLPEADQRPAEPGPANAALRYERGIVHPPEFADAGHRRAGQPERQAGKCQPRSPDESTKHPGADVVYAKSSSLLTTTDQDQGKQIQDKYKDWITDEKKLAMGQGGRHLHAPPAGRSKHRGH